MQADIDLYAAGFKKRMQERKAAFESERVDLLERVRMAGPALKALGAKEVILCGSILPSAFSIPQVPPSAPPSLSLESLPPVTPVQRNICA